MSMETVSNQVTRDAVNDPQEVKPTHPEISGWGADLAIENRPAYPKERMPARLDVPWDKPQRQPQTVEVLMSTEHAAMPPVFGTVVPPSGLSGSIRRAAFHLSENDIRHWLMLLLADRVNVVEGIMEDLIHGHVPNIFAEMGWKARLKHDRNGLARDILIMTAIAGGATYLIARKRRSDD